MLRPEAPEGQVWVTPDGTVSKRYLPNAVLCHEATLRYEDGVLLSAEPVDDETAEVPW